MGQENKLIIFPLPGIIQSPVNLQEVCLILPFLSPFKLLITTCPRQDLVPSAQPGELPSPIGSTDALCLSQDCG